MSRKTKLDKTLSAMLRKGEKRPPTKAREERLGPTPERLAKGDMVGPPPRCPGQVDAEPDAMTIMPTTEAPHGS